MNSKEFQDLRAQIDDIDARMAELFKARLDAVHLIGKYKIEHNLPTEDQAREEEHIKKTSSLLSDKSLIPYWEEYLKGLFRISKEYQWTLREDCPSRKK